MLDIIGVDNKKLVMSFTNATVVSEGVVLIVDELDRLFSHIQINLQTKFEVLSSL